MPNIYLLLKYLFSTAYYIHTAYPALDSYESYKCSRIYVLYKR